MPYLCSSLSVGSSAATSALIGGGFSFTNTYSVDFDGTDDYAAINDNFITSYGSDTQGTVSAWVYCENVSAANFPIFTLRNNGITKYLRFMQYQGRLWAGLWDGAWDWILDTDNSDLSINTWHHVALTHNGTTPILYVDGVAPAQAFTISNDITTWFNSVAVTKAEVGAFSTASQWFNGKIDELAYFSTALSAAQIAAIYNSGVPADLTPYSPSGWWRFEEGTGTSIADSSGNGHTATLTNGPTFSTDVPVAVFTNTYSVDFDGTDDYAEFSTQLLSFFDSATAFSISMRFKSDTLSGTRVIFQQEAVDIGDNFQVSVRTNGTTLQSYIRTVSGYELISKGSLSTNTWYHVLITYSGASTRHTLYVNAVQEDQDTGAGASLYNITDSSAGGRIGATSGAILRAFNGHVSEFCIWNTELTQANATAIYNSGDPLDVTMVVSNPEIYLRIEEGSGTSLTDSSGNGYTATLTNGPTWSTDVPT